MTRSSDALIAFRALNPDEKRSVAKQLEAELWGDSQERQAHDYVWFLESLDRVNCAMRATSDLEAMMSSVLDVTLQLFQCDRAWLIAPGEPSAESWRVVMEQTQPDSPGAFREPGVQPMDAESAEAFRVVLAASGAILFGPGYEQPLPEPPASRFRIHSQIAMALFPQGAKPYVLGLHQCSDRGPWRAQERRLFEEIGRRLEDALTSVLALRSLRDSERRLDDAQRIAHVGYWDRDMITGLVTLSDEACRIFGFSPEDRLVDLARWHERWLSLLDPQDRARTTEAFQVALAGGPRYEVEYRIIRNGGEVRTIHSRGEVEWGSDGRPTRMFGVMQDITERKHAERALVESHTLLQAVVEGTTDPIFIKDLEGRYLMINSAGARTLGSSPARILGKRDRELCSPEMAARAEERDAEVVATGQSQTFQESRGTGEQERHYLTTKAVYRNHAGRVIGLFGISRDVTDMVRLEERLRHAQKLEAIGRLAGGVAHDFNNLLTVINGSTDVALLETTDPAMAPLLMEIRESGQRAASLTGQLLAFSRQQVLDAKVVDLNGVLRQVGNLLKRVIGEDIELSLRLAPQLGLVKVDALQFEQAILNLAVNARDAMPEGGRLRLSTNNVELGDDFAAAQPDMRAGRYVQVAVGDSGVGMDSATIARIFEPFFTTKPVGKGTGLGLAMVYGFIKQSGGHIEVESDVGRGTVFRLYLPLAEEPPAVEPRPLVPSRQPTGRETILLVEDEDAVRRVCRRILGAQGYRLLEARNGEEALDVAARHPGEFQLLLTDLVMPRIGGRVLAAKLREALPELRVLFLSGYTEDAALMQELEGGVAFLQKPFTAATLGNKVRSLLDSPAPAPGTAARLLF